MDADESSLGIEFFLATIDRESDPPDRPPGSVFIEQVIPERRHTTAPVSLIYQRDLTAYGHLG
jgi:hypothetical protein